MAQKNELIRQRQGSQHLYASFLQRVRLSAGLTQVEIAKRMNIAQSGYARVESGAAPASGDFVVAAARAMEQNPITHLFAAGILTAEEAGVHTRDAALSPVPAEVAPHPTVDEQWIVPDDDPTDRY